MPLPTHTCGWTVNPEDKFCRGCGERIFKVSREFSEISQEMNAIKDAATRNPNPVMASMSMLVFNVLAWANGEANTRPSEVLKEMERMAERFGNQGGGSGGFGFQPPSQDQ
jgi:hypothetical protein